MGLLEFNKLPINTLVGADWKTFNAITKGREIDAAYKGKFRLTKAVCRMLSTLAPLQDKRYEKLLADKPLEHDPVFILGHWRSGTTFVHNVFSCDKHFGYNTTYQTVFPHLMMWGQPFFKKNMSWLMPDKRPTDNMELAVDLPQEEEFALANMMPYTYYNFWFLPKHQQEYADKYLLFEDISEAELKVFEETFTRLIKISLWNTHGTQFLSKNPPHTGRVKELVKMFPNAKFIYLMRNPYTVFESTSTERMAFAILPCFPITFPISVGATLSSMTISSSFSDSVTTTSSGLSTSALAITSTNSFIESTSITGYRLPLRV